MITIKKKSLKITFFVVAEAFLLFMIISSFGTFINGVSGGNVTTQTLLQVGAVFPEVLSVSINNYASSLTLTPNSTINVSCQAVLRDFNNKTNITSVIAEFFAVGNGTQGGPLNNSAHYRNVSGCTLNYSFVSFGGFPSDNFSALGTCNMSVWYYADPVSWNCTMMVNTSVNLTANGTNFTNVNSLLAIGTPDIINYGTVNQTFVSQENASNITNMGNVLLNISLQGYANALGDGNAMNCSLGANSLINITNERYNLSTSNTPTKFLNFTEFSNGTYYNLSSSYVVRKLNVQKRFNDAGIGFGDTNTTFWRIYVPIGVAGNCSGFIQFGASQSNSMLPALDP